MMEDNNFMYTQAVWILLSGVTITLVLLLMIFLTTNCLKCFRNLAARDAQLDQIPMQSTSTSAVEDDKTVTTISYQLLTIDHLQELLNKLYPARHKWNNIGVQLGMIDDLDAIKLENQNEPDACLREMFKIWLRQGKATRQALIAALNSPSVNYQDIAANLANHENGLETDLREPIIISCQPGMVQSHQAQTILSQTIPRIQILRQLSRLHTIFRCTGVNQKTRHKMLNCKVLKALSVLIVAFVL